MRPKQTPTMKRQWTVIIGITFVLLLLPHYVLQAGLTDTATLPAVQTQDQQPPQPQTQDEQPASRDRRDAQALRHDHDLEKKKNKKAPDRKWWENDFYDARTVLHMSEKLQLTPQQVQKIEDRLLEHESFSIRNSAEIKIMELRFASYLKSGKTDRQLMIKHIRDISKEKTDKIVDYLNYLLDIKAILTPRQLEILKASRTVPGKNR